MPLPLPVPGLMGREVPGRYRVRNRARARARARIGSRARAPVRNRARAHARAHARMIAWRSGKPPSSESGSGSGSGSDRQSGSGSGSDRQSGSGRVGSMTERRRRVRLIAWGVSPRCRGSHHPEAPERGRQIAAAASAAAIICRLSVAASRLEVFFRAVFLGLTPQAMNLPPLRGFG